MSNKNITQLSDISGVGPEKVAALKQLKITTLADLAQQSAGPLTQKLNKSGRLRTKLKSKVVSAWIETAKKHLVNQPEEVDWKQHAGFSLFFDHRDEASGESWRWRARINHSETDEDIELLDEDMAGWVDWIVSQAALPEEVAGQTAVPQPAELPLLPDEEEEPEPTSLDYPTTIEEEDDEPPFSLAVIDVTVSVSHEIQRLLLTVVFELVGQDAMQLAESQTFYHIDAQLYDEAEQPVHATTSAILRLQSERLIYQETLLSSIPTDGRYEVKTAVSIHPPFEMTAYHDGPVLEVALS